MNYNRSPTRYNSNISPNNIGNSYNDNTQDIIITTRDNKICPKLG